MKTSHLIVIVLVVVAIFFIASQADAGWLFGGKDHSHKPIIQGG